MIPWRLIGFLLVLTLIVCFIGFNLSNTFSISFGFAEIKDVPVFIGLFIAFITGSLIVLPFTFKRRFPPYGYPYPEPRNSKNNKQLPPKQ